MLPNSNTEQNVRNMLCVHHESFVTFVHIQENMYMLSFW